MKQHTAIYRFPSVSYCEQSVIVKDNLTSFRLVSKFLARMPSVYRSAYQQIGRKYQLRAVCLWMLSKRGPPEDVTRNSLCRDVAKFLAGLGCSTLRKRKRNKMRKKLWPHKDVEKETSCLSALTDRCYQRMLSALCHAYKHGFCEPQLSLGVTYVSSPRPETLSIKRLLDRYESVYCTCSLQRYECERGSI